MRGMEWRWKQIRLGKGEVSVMGDKRHGEGEQLTKVIGFSSRQEQ